VCEGERERERNALGKKREMVRGKLVRSENKNKK
jgi:hypothetical protein